MTGGIKQAIRTIIRRNYEAGTPERITEDIRKYMKDNGLKAEMKQKLRDLRREVERDLEKEWIKDKTGGTEYLNGVETVLKEASERFERINKTVVRDVLSAVKTGMDGNMKWQDTARLALRKLNIKEHHITTEIRTTKAALDNTVRIANIEDAGAEYVRYEGPGGTIRPFCKDHVGRVYSLKDVKNMVNMFGQPAQYYCGGYNCRHRWVPWLGKKEAGVFIHDSWNEALKNSGKTEKNTLLRELTTAKLLAKMNKNVEMNKAMTDTRLARHLGDADAIVDGNPAQFKTPEQYNRNTLKRQVEKKDQADFIYIQLDQPIEEMERAEGKLRDWLNRHRNKKVYIINNYGSNSIKEVK